MNKFKLTAIPLASYLNGRSMTLLVPTICPHCGVTIYPQFSHVSVLPIEKQIVSVIFKCTNTDCLKNILCIYEKQDQQDNKLDLLTYHPNSNSRQFNSHINELSPSFVNYYNQALFCEANNFIELAIIGYRTAIEFIVKDYAVKVLKVPFEEVKNKKLAAAISKYLPDIKLVQTADVVRIIGNDFTHYSKSDENLTFDMIKEYVEVFIHLITIHLKATNPPVKNNHK